MTFEAAKAFLLSGLKVRLARAVPTDRPLSAAEAAQFRAELEHTAAERMQGFSSLLFALHLLLTLHDLLRTEPSSSGAEQAWRDHLLSLHVAILVAALVAWLTLRGARNARLRARVAQAMTAFLLAWGGILSGVDQLIGAGITIYVVVNLGAALFITLSHRAALACFSLGVGAFLVAQTHFARSGALAFSQCINGFGFATACFIFSRMVFGARLRDFSQRRTIAAQHAELVSANSQLARARENSEALLRSVLPPRIIERLQHGESPIADTHEQLTILMADLSGFTQLASELPAAELISLLDELFSHFDSAMNAYGLEKIKTMGDAYLAVRGIAEPGAHDVVAAVNAALRMHVLVEQVAARSGRRLKLRVGIARGRAMAGVLGRDRLVYDVWGDAVNIASRLESIAQSGETLVTAELAECLLPTHELSAERSHDLKGKGPTLVRAAYGPKR